MTNCSWPDGRGHRVFGYFVKWIDDGEYAETRTQVGKFKCRVHQSNLTFEVG